MRTGEIHYLLDGQEPGAALAWLPEEKTQGAIRPPWKCFQGVSGSAQFKIKAWCFRIHPHRQKQGKGHEEGKADLENNCCEVLHSGGTLKGSVTRVGKLFPTQD